MAPYFSKSEAVFVKSFAAKTIASNPCLIVYAIAPMPARFFIFWPKDLVDSEFLFITVESFPNSF